MTTLTPVIHIIDDDDSLRIAVMRLLRVAGYDVRGYSSAMEFIKTRLDDSPGCVILDIRMPGISGLDFQSSLDKSDSLPIIILTGHGDIPTSVRAIKAGAVDFLTKPVKRDILLTAIQNAISVDTEKRQNQLKDQELRSLYESLTVRERSVFSKVVEGKLNKQIAVDLNTSERTVKAHRANMMKKLNVSSIAGLVKFAEQVRVRDS